MEQFLPSNEILRRIASSIEENNITDQTVLPTDAWFVRVRKLLEVSKQMKIKEDRIRLCVVMYHTIMVNFNKMIWNQASHAFLKTTYNKANELLRDPDIINGTSEASNVLKNMLENYTKAIDKYNFLSHLESFKNETIEIKL